MCMSHTSVGSSPPPSPPPPPSHSPGERVRMKRAGEHLEIILSGFPLVLTERMGGRGCIMEWGGGLRNISCYKKEIGQKTWNQYNGCSPQSTQTQESKRRIPRVELWIYESCVVVFFWSRTEQLTEMLLRSLTPRPQPNNSVLQVLFLLKALIALKIQMCSTGFLQPNHQILESVSSVPAPLKRSTACKRILCNIYVYSPLCEGDETWTSTHSSSANRALLHDRVKTVDWVLRS